MYFTVTYLYLFNKQLIDVVGVIWFGPSNLSGCIVEFSKNIRMLYTNVLFPFPNKSNRQTYDLMYCLYFIIFVTSACKRQR